MSLQLRNQSSGVLERVAGFNDTDSILSPTSQNPIMNKTVYNALMQKIERTVDDLVNYYDKSQTYNKTEVRELIGAINTLTIEVVVTLPVSEISATTIYFVGPAAGTNTYEEYVYVNNAWVKIGDTDIDLSTYITTSMLNTVLQDYYTKTALNAKLADEYYTKTQTNTLLDAKQNSLTFDEAPTTGSNNPVKSGGVKTALDGKQDTLQWDTVPTDSSTKSINSGNLKTAFDAKQPINLTNPVTVGSNTYETVNAALSGIGGMLNSGMSLGLTQTILPTGADMNNYYDATFKVWGNSGTDACASFKNAPSDRPNGEMGLIWIPHGNANYGTQIYFAARNGTNTVIYRRMKYGTTWQAWQKFTFS